MNMLANISFDASAESKLLKDLSKYPELLAGAVEYAFQRGDIDSREYRQWQSKIAEMKRQHTANILATIKA